MEYQEMIDGNKPSYVWEEDNIVGYSTNYGCVQLKLDTGELEYACMSIDRNGNYRQLVVKIVDKEFSVWVDKFGSTVTSDLHSSKYPYLKGNNDLSPSEVFKSLAVDDNYSVAGIAVKKNLVELMMRHLKLDREDKHELQQLFKLWRKPIITGVERKSIRRI